ncbi:MAG: hypothetical protein REJ50_26000, partial [Bordetella sp.]|nr:hypothetical protein [Bordetella sp.]
MKAGTSVPQRRVLSPAGRTIALVSLLSTAGWACAADAAPAQVPQETAQALRVVLGLTVLAVL